MIVKRAAVLGRCMGVRRAVELALKTAEGGGPAFTLGPLIHNPQAVAELEAKGVHVLRAEDIDEAVRGRAVIIRAHGVPPELKERLERHGAVVVDATCPRVLTSQRRAREYAARGLAVVIAGDKDHGEVTGIAGYAPGARVVGSAAEASALELGKPPALIAQTTIKKEEYEAIREALAQRYPLLEAVDSICPATEDRRKALVALARDCDAIVVVGGRNSANTARLHSTALSLGLPAYLVETAEELPAEVFGFARVGLSAGASTPDELIDTVEDALLRGGA